MTAEEEQILNDALENSLTLHNQNPTMYYLEEGAPEIVAQCKKVFKALKPFALKQTPIWFQSDEAIPLHPKFSLIKRHIDQIRYIYQSREPSLIQLFVGKLLPCNPMPLRFAVLSSISQFSTRVYLHSDKLSPQPLQAYIDGYFNLVINMGENVIRFPLLCELKNGQREMPALPPSIRFIGSKSEQATKDGEDNPRSDQIQKYVTETAPKTGRRTQFYSFVSILNSGKPISDFYTSLMNAIVSFDLSFATAICALSSSENHLASIRGLINILAVNHMFDHFLRCLASSVRQVVNGYLNGDIPELIALDNLFIGSCISWARGLALQYKDQATLLTQDLITRICDDLLRKNIKSETALYILRAILVIASYEDQSGDTAIAMFMEVVIRPFAVGLHLGNDFMTCKAQLTRNDDDVSEIQRLIEKTIVKIMGMKITMKYDSSKMDEQLSDIHNLITQKLDDFVRLVINLNNKQKREHPVIQMITFAFMKCGELAIY